MIQKVTLGLGVLVVAGFAFWPIFAGTKGANAIEKKRDVPFLQPDPAPWAAFLGMVVKPDGVDYTVARTPEARALLAQYLAQVARATPARFDSDDARLAFYINAYNALVIDGVLRHDVQQSVTEVGMLHRFFRERVYRVAGQKVSLHGFEKKVIMQYNPLLHFGLNCASVSCPRLQPLPFRPETLEAQLSAAASEYIRDRTHNNYEPKLHRLALSQIFNWYEDHFGGPQAVLALIRDKGFDIPSAGNLTVVYRDYDWRLNAASSP